MNDLYLNETKMLDYSSDNIQKLISERGWKSKDDYNKILEIYNFVRDEIKFGYNVNDDIPASTVLKDGYGQCNTKGTLFMALLRAVDIPCRIHGFTIDKKLQKGAMTGFVYRLAPQNVIHSWVEILHDEHWYRLEGYILDMTYLKHLQRKFSKCNGAFCGYGVATPDFQNPIIDWNKNDTFIQKNGINNDYGLFDAPDDFFIKYSQKLSAIKKLAYQHFGRHLMNHNVKQIRKACK